MDFRHNGRNVLRAAAVTCVWNGYRNKSRSAQKVDSGEENVLALPAWTRTRDLSTGTSATLYQRTVRAHSYVPARKNIVSVTQKYAKVGAGGLEPK